MRKARFLSCSLPADNFNVDVTEDVMNTITGSRQAAMALRDASAALGRLAKRDVGTLRRSTLSNCKRQASSGAVAVKELAEDIDDLESNSSLTTSGASEEVIKKYDPVKRSQARRKELPPSRYQFRSPRFYRGPLHPHQPPPASDPSSRVFVPGPFLPCRLKQTWQSTIAPDLMALTYSHKPPGTITEPKAPRLREWDDSSPYHKNRPKRGPRGGDVLRPIEQDINWHNIPQIKEITVHSMVKRAIDDSAYLHVAGLMLQSITGVRPTVHRVKHGMATWGLREKQPISLTCTMRGDDAWAFMDKCANLVFPQMKDWPGVNGSTGDSSGNLAWGFTPEAAILFPEVSINYDMYPPKMIPGFHVLCKTTATSDRHARLLLSALGVPFHGKYVD